MKFYLFVLLAAVFLIADWAVDLILNLMPLLY